MPIYRSLHQVEVSNEFDNLICFAFNPVQRSSMHPYFRRSLLVVTDLHNDKEGNKIYQIMISVESFE